MKSSALLAMSALSDPINTNMDDQSGVAQGAFAGTLVFIGIVLLFTLAVTVFWVWSIIDVARTPDAAWNYVGQSKVVWLVLLVLLGAVVSLVYVFWPRPLLKKAAMVTGPVLPPPTV